MLNKIFDRLVGIPGRVKLPEVDEIRIDNPKKEDDVVPGHWAVFSLVHNPGTRLFENHQTVFIKLYFYNQPPRHLLEKLLKTHGFDIGKNLSLLDVIILG